MATDPKIKPCAKCQNDENISMYQYVESRCWHVECDKCHYLGPAEGSRRQAIKSHNAKFLETTVG